MFKSYIHKIFEKSASQARDHGPGPQRTHGPQGPQGPKAWASGDPWASRTRGHGAHGALRPMGPLRPRPWDPRVPEAHGSPEPPPGTPGGLKSKKKQWKIEHRA